MLSGETLQFQVINNGPKNEIIDLHVVGAGAGGNNVVARNAEDPAPFGGGLGTRGRDSAAMFGADDWGSQDGLWGRRFSRYNPPNDVAYFKGILTEEACEQLPGGMRVVDMCKWDYAQDGLREASLPKSTTRRIKCPEALWKRSGCLLEEDA